MGTAFPHCFCPKFTVDVYFYSMRSNISFQTSLPYPFFEMKIWWKTMELQNPGMSPRLEPKVVQKELPKRVRHKEFVGEQRKKMKIFLSQVTADIARKMFNFPNLVW